ncbi:hypothetical protein BKA70DRAFT_266057 [Coprinopsis sp. MPI-PUGE-AT-0042]|nr:hypothetical protein BKA70DRAFT_266057 [Coprinopsis sp. MPI-PUGE-AT-0042]
MLDTLVDIILSCTNLKALSIQCENWGTNMDIGVILPKLLKACPSLERLELRLMGASLDDDGALPSLHHHLCRSLKTLWVSSQILHQLFRRATTLPQLHALVVERTTLKGNEKRSAIFSSPEVVYPIDYRALATVSPQGFKHFWRPYTKRRPVQAPGCSRAVFPRARARNTHSTPFPGASHVHHRHVQGGTDVVVGNCVFTVDSNAREESVENREEPITFVSSRR